MKARDPRFWILAIGLVAAASGCGSFAAEGFGGPFGDESTTGSVMGRVLDANNVAHAGTRVFLADPSGPTTISQPDGTFRVAGARTGTTELFAYDAATDSAAYAVFTLHGTTTDIGDLTLESCTVVLSEPSPDPGTVKACSDPPPTPDASTDTDYGVLEFEQALAERYSNALYITIYAHTQEATPRDVTLTVSIPATELSSTGYTGTVTYDYNAQIGSIFVTLYDSSLGATFVLSTGSITYTLYDDGVDNGLNPFDFDGTAMEFQFIDPNTAAADENFLATIDEVKAWGDEFPKS